MPIRLEAVLTVLTVLTVLLLQKKMQQATQQQRASQLLPRQPRTGLQFVQESDEAQTVLPAC